MTSFRAAIGASLSLALALTGPGLAPYQALAADTSGRDGARPSIPNPAAAPQIPSAGVPELPPPAAILAAGTPSSLPSASASLPAPVQAPALKPEVPAAEKDAPGIRGRLAEPLPQLENAPASGAKEEAGRDFEERAFGLGPGETAAGSASVL